MNPDMSVTGEGSCDAVLTALASSKMPDER